MPVSVYDDVEKIYYNYNEIHGQLAELAKKHLISKQFDAIIAIGDGGYIPARILRTFLNCPIYCISVKSYTDKTQSSTTTRQWIDCPEKLKGLRLLVVDEIDDTRSTLAYCVNKLEASQPANITIAILHNKCKEKASCAKDLDKRYTYFAAENVPDKWIVYPWELETPLLNSEVCVST